MPKANLGDVEIYYEVQGEGEPVLFAPASWWPSDTWNVTVVPFLSKRFKTIIFDCRGNRPEQQAERRFHGGAICSGLHRLAGGILASPVAMPWVSLSAGRSCKRWPSSGRTWWQRSPSPLQGRERKP